MFHCFHATFFSDLTDKIKVDFVTPPIFEKVELVKSTFKVELTKKVILTF